MHIDPDQTTTPRSLHQSALHLWHQDTTADPQSYPYIAASDAVASGSSPRSADRRPANWIIALNHFEQFTSAHGRTPRENSRNRADVPTFERRLGEWARYQRRFEATLTRFQHARLDVSPGFIWDLGETEWNRRAGDLRTHTLEHGALPLLTSGDAREFALARWLGRQLRLNQTRALTPTRKERLEQLLQDPRAHSADV